MDASNPRYLAGPLLEHDAGIWQVRIPLPARVAPVNAWLLVDPDGAITVFDAGIAPHATDRWREALAAIGAAPRDVQRIIVSHHHPDHIGGAGPLHRLTGAPVLASRSTIQQAPDVWGDRGRMESYFRDVAAHLREHGMPQPDVDALAADETQARLLVDLPPDAAWQELGEGDLLELASRTWRVRLTPGHADGHLVLHDEQGGLLLAGDHLLERISPAVGRFPRHERDPLGRYLESLMVVAMLGRTSVLPGHGAPFADAPARARVLVQHHAERVDACVAAVEDLGAATAWQVAHHVFERVFDAAEPDLQEQRFATTETIAHLERARVEGRVTRSRDEGGRTSYAPAGA